MSATPLAARLFGVAEALREIIGASLWPANRLEYERSLALLHQSLDETTLAGEWAQGRRMMSRGFEAAAMLHASSTHISAAMPAATHEAQARAEQLRRQPELQLTPQRIEAIQAQARAKSFDTIVQTCVWPRAPAQPP